MQSRAFAGRCCLGLPPPLRAAGVCRSPPLLAVPLMLVRLCADPIHPCAVSTFLFTLPHPAAARLSLMKQRFKAEVLARRQAEGVPDSAPLQVSEVSEPQLWRLAGACFRCGSLLHLIGGCSDATQAAHAEARAAKRKEQAALGREAQLQQKIQRLESELSRHVAAAGATATAAEAAAPAAAPLPPAPLPFEEEGPSAMEM